MPATMDPEPYAPVGADPRPVLVCRLLHGGRGVDWSNAVCRLRQARFPNVTRATTACEPSGAELPFTHRGLCLALNQIGTGRLVLIDPAPRPQ